MKMQKVVQTQARVIINPDTKKTNEKFLFEFDQDEEPKDKFDSKNLRIVHNDSKE